MTIVHVDSSQRIDEAVAVLTLAFCDDPIVRWLYPRPRQVLESFPRLIEAFCRHGFEAWTGRLADDGSGAAVWLAPGVHVDDQALEEAATHDFDGAMGAEVQELFGRMDEYHPTMPHWYLPLIGVEPRNRNKGLGSRLLEETLRTCDDTQSIAYLESTNPRNVSLYRRQGFEPMGRIQVGSSPEMIPMLRKPQPVS